MIAEYFVNLPVRAIKGTIKFFRFWYVQSSKDFWNKEISFLKQIEKDLGVIINLKLIFQPNRHLFNLDNFATARFLDGIFEFGLCALNRSIVVLLNCYF